MKQFKFKARINKPEGDGTWHYANVPMDVEKEFGKKGQVKVKATLNGKVFYNSLMPHGNGKHFIVLKDQIRNQAGVKLGDTVIMTIEFDERARTVEPPEDFERELMKNQIALNFFNSLSNSYKQRYVDWIATAQKEGPRIERIAKAIKMLELKEKMD
jgi:hypothetical protein